MARILGVSCFFHDAAAALWTTARSSARPRRSASRAGSTTRRSRAGDRLLPAQAAESGRPIDYVAFYEQPSTKFRRVLTTAAAMGKPAEDAFVALDAGVADGAAWDPRAAERTRARPGDRVLFTDHHVSHAASAFFPSPFESAA